MREVQLRGGTREEHLTGRGTGFIGLEREVTVDTTNWSLRVHDGKTVGGILLAKSDDVYDKAEVDKKILEFNSNGEISLDGYAKKEELNGYSLEGHEHLEYATSDHTHSGFSNIVHSHGALDIEFEDGETLLYKYENNKLANVDMNDYLLKEDFEIHEHNNYSPINHTHQNLSPVDHNHDDIYSKVGHSHIEHVTIDDLNSVSSSKANLNHEHNSDDIKVGDTLLSNILLGFANKDHQHKEYYTKEEVISIIKELIDSKYTKITINSDEWSEYNIDTPMYYYQLQHNLNSMDVSVIATCDNKRELVDYEIVGLDSIIILSDKQCTLDVTIKCL